MPAPAWCPGCGTKLEPDWENCPNCPRSFVDEAPAQSPLKSDGFRNGVMPVVFFLGLGLFIWKMGSFFFSQVEANNRQTEAEAKTAQRAALAAHGIGSGMAPEDAARAVQRGTPEDLAAVRAALDQNARAAGGSAPVPTASEAAAADSETGSGVISITPQAAGTRAPRPAREWKLRGVVYDLVTLKPVAGATMTFIDNQTNSRAVSTTDSKGRYRIILPPLEGRGYLVAIAKAGYEKTYLNPGTEGVAEMPVERRLELSRELGETVGEPASLEPPSEDPFPTDFHIAPKNR